MKKTIIYMSGTKSLMPATAVAVKCDIFKMEIFPNQKESVVANMSSRGILVLN
jgi:hypothetical protein